MCDVPAKVGGLFVRAPFQWGLRGDPGAWAAMQDLLADVDMPDNVFTLLDLLVDAFETVVGVPLRTHDEDVVWVEAFNRGGISGGAVSLTVWRERLIHLLIDRSHLV